MKSSHQVIDLIDRALALCQNASARSHSARRDEFERVRGELLVPPSAPRAPESPEGGGDIPAPPRTPAGHPPEPSEVAGMPRPSGGKLTRSATNPDVWIYRTITGKTFELRPSTDLIPGTGFTSLSEGHIQYSTRGTRVDRRLAFYHELVHATLTPRLKLLRNLRLASYSRKGLYRYVEEVLSEGYARLRVNGIRELPDVIRFPLERGYIRLDRLKQDIGVLTGASIVVGGIVYAITESD